MSWLGAGLLQEELDCLVEGEDGVRVGPHPGPRLVDGLGGQVHVHTRIVRHLSANIVPSAVANEINMNKCLLLDKKDTLPKLLADVWPTQFGRDRKYKNRNGMVWLEDVEILKFSSKY